MPRPLSIRRHSLLILTVLAVALAALWLTDDRAFTMAASPAPVAPLATILVTNTNNSGAGSLRQAIIDANSSAGPDVIDFQPGLTGTITLATALPGLTSMSINGPGANVLTVQRSTAPGTPLFSIFSIFGQGQDLTVSISGLTLTNGDSAENGGAIRNFFATLAVSGLTISNNHTTAGGSAILNSSGNVTVTNSTISGNLAGDFAAIYNQVGTFTISNSTLTANRNESSFPGTAIFNDFDTAVFNVINCTISGNIGQGVAVNHNVGSSAPGRLNLKNSIVAGNTGGDTNGTTDQGNNLIGGNPLLGPLQNNGGSTQTMALLAGSPAIDAGNNCVVTNACSPAYGFSLTTDQRGPGFSRSRDGNNDGTATVDIGAFEALMVTNTNDAGAGSLRQAITDANANPGSDTITFNIPAGAPGCTAGGVCTITLATALPDLSSNISIQGPGANRLTVTRSEAPATPQFSIFTIQQNATVAISGLSLMNADTAQSGGAIRNLGALTLSGLVIANNRTTAGGSALHNGSTGTVTLANSSIWENVITGPDGFAAVYNSGSSVSIINTTFAGNQNPAGAPGTAIFSESESITNVTSCTISENIGQAAAVHQNPTGSGALRLKNSIVSGNAGGNTSNVTNLGNNLIGGFSGLGPLQLNGGPTQTMALLAGSPAFDAGIDLTTLVSAIDNAITTINVADGASIPAGVGVAIRIDDEQMVVTGKAGNTLTVTRGANSSSAAAHAAGAAVNLAFDQRGANFPRKADGPDANTTQTLDIGAFEANASVEDISDKSTDEDVPVPTFTFNVGDAATAFSSIIATSSEPDVVPNSNIVIGSPTASTRTLSITPAPNQSGFVIIVVTVTKGSQTMSDLFFLIINPVNDPPSFTKGANQTVAEDSGPQSVPNWATAISEGGAADEAGQALTFNITGNTNPGLFSAGPAISSTGALTYTPAANASGSATITVSLKDDAGGTDTSPSQTFAINITPVADTPSVTNATTNANTQTTSGLVISRNPVDGAEVTHFKITGITGGALFKNNGTTPINNGDFITFAEGNAGLKFTPGTTNGSFTVRASTSASDAGLGGGTATATITTNALGGVIRFSNGNYSVAEGAGSSTITVERSGDASQAVTVDYASSDHSNPADFLPCTSPGAGFASSRCDFTTAVGTLRFAAGETSKTFNVLISDDNYVEGTETLELTLSNPAGGAVFGVPQTAILSITDDATEPATNRVDISSEFVRSQYHDFLNREPDAPGLAFWTDNIEKCNDPLRRPAGQTAADCIDKQRESTAVAFFSSPEFQMTGGFVYRLYKGSLTGTPNYDGGSPGRFPTSLEFMSDVSQVSEGIVVNNQISGAVVEANRNRLAAAFVQRPEFVAKYGGLNNTLYVQELFNTTAINATAADRQALVDGLNAGTETKASVLRKVVDGTVVITESNVQFTTTYGQAFYDQENRRVFVFMEYVGYLRRNPDTAGFVFWLDKLNTYNGDPFQAEMVRAFILSPEYRNRFGQ